MSDNEFVGGGKDLQGHDNILVRLGNTECNPNSFDFPKSCQHPDSKNVSHVAADLSILPNDFSESCDQTQINQERSISNLSTLERGNSMSDITSYLHEKDVARSQEVLVPSEEAGTHNTRPRTPVATPRRSLEKSKSLRHNKAETIPQREITKSLRLDRIALHKIQHVPRTPSIGVFENKTGQTSTSTKSPVSAPRPSITIAEVPHHDTILTFCPKEIAKPTHPSGIVLEKKQDLSKTSEIVLPEEKTESTSTSPKSPVSAPRPSMTIAEVPHHDTILTFPKGVAKPTHLGGIALEKTEDFSKTSEIVHPEGNTESTSTSPKSPVAAPRPSMTIAEVTHHDTRLTFRPREIAKPTHADGIALEKRKDLSKTSEIVLPEGNTESTSTSPKSPVAAPRTSMTIAEVTHHDTRLTFRPREIAKPTHADGIALVKRQDLSKTSEIVLSEENKESISTSAKSPVAAPRPNMTITEVPHHDTRLTFRPKEITKPTHPGGFALEKKQDHSKTSEIVLPEENTESTSTIPKSPVSEPGPSMTIAEVPYHDTILTFPKEVAKPTHLGGIALEKKQDLSKTSEIVLPEENTKSTSTSTKSPVSSPRPSMTITEVPHHDTILTFPKEVATPTHPGGIALEKKQDFSKASEVVVTEKQNTESTSTSPKLPVPHPHITFTIISTPNVGTLTQKAKSEVASPQASVNIENPKRAMSTHLTYPQEISSRLLPSRLLEEELGVASVQEEPKMQDTNVKQANKISPLIPSRIAPPRPIINQNSNSHQPKKPADCLGNRNVLESDVSKAATLNIQNVQRTAQRSTERIPTKRSYANQEPTHGKYFSLRKPTPNENYNQKFQRINSLEDDIATQIRPHQTFQTFGKKASSQNEHSMLCPNEEISKESPEQQQQPKLPPRITSRSQSLNRDKLQTSCSLIEWQQKVENHSIGQTMPPGTQPTHFSGVSHAAPQSDIKEKASLSEDSSTSTLREPESKSPKQSNKISLLAQAISIPVRSPQTVETFDKKESRLDARTNIFPKLLQPVTMSPRHEQIRKVSQEHKLPPELARRILSRSQALNQNHLPNSSPVNLLTSIKGGSVLERQPKLEMTPGAQLTPFAGASQVSPQNNIKGKTSLSEDSSTSTLRQPESKSPKQSHKISLLAQAISIPVRSPQTFKPFDKKESRQDEKSKKSHQLSKSDILSPRYDEIRKVFQEHELPPELPPRITSRSQSLNRDKLQTSWSLIEWQQKVENHSKGQTMPPGTQPTHFPGVSHAAPQSDIKEKASLSEDSSTSTLRKTNPKSPKQAHKICLLAQAISIPVRSPQSFKPFDKKESRQDEKSKKSHQLSKSDILSPRHNEIRKVSQEHELPPELPPRVISRSQLLKQDKLQNSSPVKQQNSVTGGSVLERLPELKKHGIRHIMPTGTHPKTLAAAQNISPLRDTEQNRDHFYEVIPSSHRQLAFNEKQMGNAENSEKVRPINLEARTVEAVHDHAQINWRPYELQNNTNKANQPTARSLMKHKQFFQTKRDGRSLLETTIEEIEKRWNEKKKKEIVRKLLKEVLTTEAIDTFLFLRYELHYKLSDCFEAVESSDGDALAAMGFFQDCSICYEVTIMSKITGNPSCQCHVCTCCFTKHFTMLVQTTPCMYKFVCPSCELPDLETCSEEEFHDYFSMLGILLKLHLSSSDCELYHQKLVSWKLMTIPTFRWCANGCGNGFINERNTKKIQCSNCGKYQCFGCNKPWLKQHEGTTCEAFENWKQNNDPAFQAQGLAAHLRENGINCPRCKMRYELAKGGCMHFKCSQCMHEFCCGCNLPFVKFLKCPKISCVGRGLHAHHPRNCLYYLRDKKCATLHKLLKNHKVKFKRAVALTNHPEDKGCPVKEQQESPNGLVDANCGRPLEDKTGLCETHYKEYLVSVINKYNIDPADILTATELGADLKRNEQHVPRQVSGETAEMYCKRLRKLLKEKVPLWRLSEVTT